LDDVGVEQYHLLDGSQDQMALADEEHEDY
jgi:hypothetical protein